MATPLSYKKPRSINVASVAVFVVLGGLAYYAVRVVPLYFLRQNVFAELEQAGSEYRHFYPRAEANPTEADEFRTKLMRKIREAGVTDPALEVWIERDEGVITMGAAYLVVLEWPLHLIKPSERVYEVEHIFTVKRPQS